MKRKRKLTRLFIKLINAWATQLNQQHLAQVIPRRQLHQQLHRQPQQLHQSQRRHQLENVRTQIINMEWLLLPMALEAVHQRYVYRSRAGPYRFHSQNEISTFPQPFFWCSLNGHSQKKFWLWNFFKPPQPKIIYGCGTFWNRHSQKTFGYGNLISSNHSWVLTVNSQSDTVYSNGTEVLKILDSDSKIEVSQIIRDADSFIIKVKVTSNRS